MRAAPSQAVTDNFLVKNSAGELVDADSTPEAKLYRKGAVTAIEVSVASVTGTGKYSFAFDNGAYDSGDPIWIEITATVDGTAYTAKVWEATVDAKIPLAAEIASVARDSILNRALSGNHDTSGTVGKLLQALSGITSLLAILKKMIRADFTDATAESEIGGTYDDATDSLEAKGTVIAAVKAKTDLIGTGSATISQPVAEDGTLSAPIIIGDDYRATNGRAFEWTIDAITGVTVGTATSRFGLSHPSKGSVVVTGTVTDNEDGTWTLSHDVLKTDTTALDPGEYDWSVQVVDEDGIEITRVRNDGDCYKTRLVEKQT